MLSPGTFGHGGAYGTQAWIDPQKNLIYISWSSAPISATRMIRACANLQQAAAEAVAK